MTTLQTAGAAMDSADAGTWNFEKYGAIGERRSL